MLPYASMTKQYSPFLPFRSRIQRLKTRLLSTASDSQSSSRGEQKEVPFSSSTAFRILYGIAAGSSLGLCLWSSPQHSSSFFTSAASWNAATKKDDSNDAHQHSILGNEMEEAKKSKYLFQDSYRKRVFFKYEKRIRLRSPPEKVFEYFASYRSPEGEVFMTPADLMRAVVPVFPPSESDVVREGHLRGEKQTGQLHHADSAFFMLFDTNNDHLISFPEYIFFVTLLSIPESSFAVAFKMFDLNNNGEIEQDEFKKVMALMRSYNRQGASHRDGKRNGLKIGSSVESGGLLEYFFGKDGTKRLQHQKFFQFLKDLHNEMLWLEFVHYDWKLQGSMAAKDFALSAVASADLNQINRLLDRVDELDRDPHLRDMRISWEEFRAFAELRKSLQPLALAIFSHGKVNGLLTKKDFQHAACHVCGISITDNVVDVIFHVFDANRDGDLGVDEFLAVLQRRERETCNLTDTGVAGLISCWWNCARACAYARVL